MEIQKNIWYVTLLLTMIAGYCDTVTFVAADSIFSAHVTGNFIVFAYQIVKGSRLKEELNEINIKRELDLILGGKNREDQLTNYTELTEIVGKAGASVRTAELIYKRCSTN